jgi:hypothetical protein
MFDSRLKSGLVILDADGEPSNYLVLDGSRKAKTTPIDPQRLYTPREVADLLQISYDTAARRMRDMRGCIDLGSKETLKKRPKAKLRISGKALQAYLRGREM